MTAGSRNKRELRYFNGDTSHAHELKCCPQCHVEDWLPTRSTFCSLKCALESRKGSGNPLWKGENAGYVAMHARVYRRRGAAATCVFDGEHKAPFHWANLLGDYSDPNDYAPMCVTCHRRYDNSVRKVMTGDG